MEEPGGGDLILHFLEDDWDEAGKETRWVAVSRVRSPARRVEHEPPEPGSWSGMAPYYRIDLDGYRELPTALPIPRLLTTYGDEIRREIMVDRPHHYPFAPHGADLRTTQGLYLARCTPNLYELLHNALGIEASMTPEGAVGSSEDDPHAAYAEGRRMAREQGYFSRNSALVRDAKEHYGYACRVCGFDFEKAYGELGRGYIECHHLKPLASREEYEASTLADVTVVCSNCHRMLHRQRPALSPSDLRRRLKEAGER